MKQYDIAVIGCGAGGAAAALLAAERNARVLLIDKGPKGGNWLHEGCVPVKTLMACQKMYRHLQHAQDYGIHVSHIRPSMAEWLSRQRAVISKVSEDLDRKLAARHVETLRASAQLIGNNRLLLTEDGRSPWEAYARKIILATGARPATMPGFETADGTTVGYSHHFVHLTQAPPELVIVGGGYIGCELGEIFHAAGTRVTVIESQLELLPQMDPEAGAFLRAKFESENMTVLTGVKVEKLETEPPSVENGSTGSISDAQNGGAVGVPRAVLHLSNGKVLRTDRVLLAVGRRPNVAFLNLDAAGVQMDDENGGVLVNDFLQTTNPDIYAVGDINARAPLAHSAAAQAVIAVDHALGGSRAMLWDNIPFCVYTVPEIASVGYSEAMARRRGHEIVTSRCSFRSVGKAVALGELEGFVKIIADAHSRKILGGLIVGHEASELIAQIGLALQFRASVQDVADTIFAHPSLSEAIQEAARSLTNQRQRDQQNQRDQRDSGAGFGDANAVNVAQEWTV
ncbi:MAG TPA: NAD(P)/FAD-dependent oxidoreductase [Candidatus Methylacidiphilales bacterium]|nr:NAD(P)/FAD-dependent oxidoreductase [Candidatus Methylacidiphilales bacterium]